MDSARFRSNHAASVLVGVVVALLAPLVLAGPAAAKPVFMASPRARNSAVPLGPIGFGAIVVDSANGHVFVSGSTANVVDVFDLAGTLVKTISTQYGAVGMVIHGSTLYVVLTTTGTIEKISLATLDDQGALTTGLVQPRWVAFAGDQLWTTSSPQIGLTNLVSVSLTGTVMSFPGAPFSADFATSPATPNALYVAVDGSSPGSITRYDVSSGTPVVAANNGATDQENIEGAAVSPDGTRVIPVSGYPYKFEELGASTLQPDGIVYPGDPYPSAVAVSPGNGGLLATGLDNGYSSPDVRVFQLGKPAAIFTASTNAPNGTANVQPHGLAMTDDGSMLYVITVSDQTGPSLNVFTIGPPAPTILPTTTTLAATPPNPLFGSPVTITATVAPTSPSGKSPTGTVKFYLDGQITPVVTANLVGGFASFSTTGLAHASHSVVAVYSGDANFATSTSASLVETVNCSDTITGVHTGSIVITSGSTCIVGARIHGAVVVTNGASADIEGTVVYGTISSSRAYATRICASAVTGSVLVGHATGLTMVGDPGPAGCGPNIIAGTLVLRDNHGGVEAINNYARHLVANSNDGPGPFPGDVTTISGNWSN